MNLQGKPIVSPATQKSATALVVTSLVIFLAKVYEVPIDDLVVFGVNIPLGAIHGAAGAVIFFQIVNHVIHWAGDWHSSAVWNSADKVNGVARISGNVAILSKLDAALDKLDLVTKDHRIESAIRDEKTIEDFRAEVAQCATDLKSIASDVSGFSHFALFYFFVWYLIFPTVFGLLAWFLPSTVLW